MRAGLESLTADEDWGAGRAECGPRTGLAKAWRLRVQRQRPSLASSSCMFDRVLLLHVRLRPPSDVRAGSLASSSTNPHAVEACGGGTRTAPHARRVHDTDAALLHMCMPSSSATAHSRVLVMTDAYALRMVFPCAGALAMRLDRAVQHQSRARPSPRRRVSDGSHFQGRSLSD